MTEPQVWTLIGVFAAVMIGVISLLLRQSHKTLTVLSHQNESTLASLTHQNGSTLASFR